MIEEMIDLKIRQHSEIQLKHNTPELAWLVSEKRQAERQRLDEIKAELIQFLGS